MSANNKNSNAGCLVIFILVCACILFLSLYNPNAVDGTVASLSPGTSWSLNLETNLESPHGAYRTKNLMAYLIHDADSITIPVKDADTTSKNFSNLSVAIITVKGVPVVSGKEQIVIKLKFDVPKDKVWIEKESIIRMHADLEYPYYDIIDAAIGSISGNLDMQLKSVPLFSQQDVFITTEKKSSYCLYLKRGVVIMLGILILYGLYLFFQVKTD